MNLVPMAISAVGFILLGIFFEDLSANKFDLAGVGSVVYLGVFGSIVAFTSYYWLLKRVSVLNDVTRRFYNSHTCPSAWVGIL
ncbi:MAG: EamA family transporter [Ignavibacteriales bacterium]|nr:EamA family transporter [Ignavibacteriales bacterium]